MKERMTASMDVKAKIEALVEKIQSDEALKAQFREDPVKAVERVVGVDLPDDAVQNIVTGVKAKLKLDALGGLFGKK